MKYLGRFKVLPIALALVASAVAADEGGPKVVGTVFTQYPADEFEGSQYRQVVSDAFAARQDAARKWSLLQPALAFCDKKQDSPSRVWVAVSTQAERDELLASRRDARKLAFVDIACPRTYQTAAYFAAEDGDTERAVQLLERGQRLAPFVASLHSERAFLYNAAGDRQKALTAYRRALALAERYPSALTEKPMALRGIGWTLVELGDLDGARQAYEQSLVAEPGNPLATEELAYIRKLVDNGGAAPNTDAFQTAAEKGTALLPDDKARVLVFTSLLETQPFHPQAKAMRSWLIQWLTDAPDVSVTVCNTLGVVGDPPPRHGPELMVQGMFGMAAHLIRHPEDQENEPEIQRAGAESALLAYSAILREQPEAQVASLDALLEYQAAGEFEARFAEIVARECKGDADQAEVQ